MKKILGLDLGTTSVGWAYVHESEREEDESKIIGAGVRLVSLSTEEINDFSAGNKISLNAGRTLARGARRSLQRYKLRRNALINLFKNNGWINPENHYAEIGSRSTHSTIMLRAKAATEKIDFEDFLKVLISINKKRGYKSSRKDKFVSGNGVEIDSMVIAKELMDKKITPGQWVDNYFNTVGFAKVPDFYPSDLTNELVSIINHQAQHYPEINVSHLINLILNKNSRVVHAIFQKEYGIETSENKGLRSERIKHLYALRNKAIGQKISLEDLCLILSEISGQIQGASGYLSAISDRSKQLMIHDQTVGQFLANLITENPNNRTKGLIFNRQDYLNEFEKIWECQSKFHPELTLEVKIEIRDIIIFYQRKLRSQKHLVANCEFERHRKTIPKSSPLFQIFRIWQNINNIEYTNLDNPQDKFVLSEDEKVYLFTYLNQFDKIKAETVKKIFNWNKSIELNFKEIQGNRTRSEFLDTFEKIFEEEGHTLERNYKNAEQYELDLAALLDHYNLPQNLLSISLKTETEINNFEKSLYYQLWHVIYSAEEDQYVKDWLKKNLSISESWLNKLVNIPLETDYGSLSAKAIKKILPHLFDGLKYDVACGITGYNHSKSFTKEENETRPLIDRIPEIKKNSLRNPVVEKILNQMVNVINAINDSEKYGKPDEIRIELARELKSNAVQRKSMANKIAENTKRNDQIKNIISKEFGNSYVTKNNILRYKLWEECGRISIYTGKVIAASQLFDSDIDIDHIIPQSRLFDDSLSNKVLCERVINIEKGNKTAISFLSEKYGDQSQEFQQFKARIQELKENGNISATKWKKLNMADDEIPQGFIDRQLRETQYIAKKAKEILLTYARNVVSTSGDVTDRLRKDWGIEELLKELNLERYKVNPGNIEEFTNAAGKRIVRIKNWSKRDDHRHHAMDAITVAFTRPAYIQYLNTLNSKNDKDSVTYAIENKYLSRLKGGKLTFKPPISSMRVECRKILSEIIISHKSKSKVITKSVNTIKKKTGITRVYKNQGSVRGKLHLETLFGEFSRYQTKEIKIGSSTTLEQLLLVANKKYREALITRFEEYNNDSKSAFSGKNSLTQNPIYLDKLKRNKIPDKVKIVHLEKDYSSRKPVIPGLNVDKIIDAGIRNILIKRLAEFNNNDKEAFANLDQNPIWFNKEKGIAIKFVKIKGISNAVSIHEKRNNLGEKIIGSNGAGIPTSWVNTGNNHHVAIYQDEQGELQEEVVSFLEAVTRKSMGLDVVLKSHPSKGNLIITLKSNELFLFPGTNFNPYEVDLKDPKNKSIIADHVFRVQKFSKGDYYFRHQFETKVSSDKDIKDITFKRIRNAGNLFAIRKIRVNIIGELVDL